MSNLSLFEFGSHEAKPAAGLATAAKQPPTEPLPSLAGNPEISIANDIKQSLARRRKVILDHLRSRLRTLYLQRKAAGWDPAYVSADDARLMLDSDDRFPTPQQLNRNFLGALFLGKEWEPTGQQIKSKTPGSHANRLMCWRWVGKPLGDDQ